MQNIQDQLNTIVKLFNNGQKIIALNKTSLLISTNKKNIELFLSRVIFFGQKVEAEE